MSASYYAVRSGRTPGIYQTWNECSAQVHGFSNAIFKKFSNYEDAAAFLDENNTLQEDISTSTIGAIAYVDGSYSPQLHKASYGIVLLYQGGTYEFCGLVPSQKELLALRNIAGEITAAQRVTEYCLERNIPSLDIYHDYKGISCWVTKEWKAHNPFTKQYSKNMREYMNRISIRFFKVKAHSGDVYNNQADKLAKSALYE